LFISSLFEYNKFIFFTKTTRVKYRNRSASHAISVCAQNKQILKNMGIICTTQLR